MLLLQEDQPLRAARVTRPESWPEWHCMQSHITPSADSSLVCTDVSPSLLHQHHQHSIQDMHADVAAAGCKRCHLSGVSLGVAPAVECSADALLEWDACACSKLAPGALSDGVDAAESEPGSAVKDMPAGACIKLDCSRTVKMALLV